MIFPETNEFLRLAKHGNLVPVWTSVPADLLTPVSAYLKLTQTQDRSKRPDNDFSFLLESVEGGENIARYTYLGSDPMMILRYWLPDGKRSTNQKQNGTVEIIEKGKSKKIPGSLMEVSKNMLATIKPVRIPTLPPFSAGAVGYIAYDLVSQLEPVHLPEPERVKRAMPDAILMFCTTLLVFDHVKHQIIILCNVRCETGATKRDLREAYKAAEEEIQRIERKLQAPLKLEIEGRKLSVPSVLSVSTTNSAKSTNAIPSVRSNVTKKQFEKQVLKAKEHITAGDIFQVVLSQRLEANITVKPFEIYRALRRVNPAPYLYFLRMGKDCVVGSSPEMLVKVTGEDVEYRPIAGTRRRGKDLAEDKDLERELLADEKERAEHVMLVDLGRNDVGRVCRFGTVEVPSFMFVERYSHVMHLVSSVKGKLRPDLDAWDTLWACFPAGTVSGAPKVRAMQIISELEPTRRGVYAGSVMYMDFSGNLNSCIAIRTIVVTDGKAYVQVGAGIVADSVPEREYEETINKGKAMLKAIEIAEAGGAKKKKAPKRKPRAAQARSGRR
ncbi:MAG: anthranilate synthase component I [Acidobacteria bacterium RIFCSPLOWO2_12_FULL_54_10]|nr:MAG: anthranilate synthase component I [Acidobacteria bacterium RIFCSPLOWO2_12_FULL_54_10]